MTSESKINNVLLVLSLLTLVITLPGCGRKEAKKYGQPISDYSLTPIDSILKDPQSFEDKTVTVQGKIITECPAGGWFDLADRATVIYVDLHPMGFAIPQRVGKIAIAQGKVLIRDNKPVIVGTGVEVK
jgi:hypothetical protein